MRQTLGEYRVGIALKPSGDQTVDAIRKLGAALIDNIDMINGDDPTSSKAGEMARLKALAITHIENGVMWAVKAATKQERD